MNWVLKLVDFTCSAQWRPRATALAHFSLCLTKEMFVNETLRFCMAVLQHLNNFKLLLKSHIMDQIVETIALWASCGAHQDAVSESVAAEIKYSTGASCH